LIHGFEQATADTPFQISVSNSCNEPLRQEAILRQITENGVSGVAIVPTTFPPTPPEQLQRLMDRGIPLVFCHRPVEDVSAPLVMWSGESVGRLTAEALLSKGHKRFASIVAFRDPKMSEVIRGIQDTLVDAGLDISAFTIRYHGAGTLLKEMMSGERPLGGSQRIEIPVSVLDGETMCLPRAQ
jgi:DNA-binding LacI/PurR family transcriptional regulator